MEMKRTPKSGAPVNCPVIGESRRITVLSKDLTRALRRLRRSLQRCRHCPANDECPILDTFNSSVDAAIQQVVDEWGELS